MDHLGIKIKKGNLALFLLSFLLLLGKGYAQTGVKADAELSTMVTVFANEINLAVAKGNSREALHCYTMDESDLQYWLGQFEFTEEVLAQMSKIEFYNKLESWATEAWSARLMVLVGDTWQWTPFRRWAMAIQARR